VGTTVRKYWKIEKAEEGSRQKKSIRQLRSEENGRRKGREETRAEVEVS